MLIFISGKTRTSKSKDPPIINIPPDLTNTSDPNPPTLNLSNPIKSSAVPTATVGAIDEIDNPFTTSATPNPVTPKHVTFSLPSDPIKDHQLSDSPWLYLPSDAHNIQPHRGTPISPENISDVLETPQSHKSTQSPSSHQSRHTTTPNMPVQSPCFGPQCSKVYSFHKVRTGREL